MLIHPLITDSESLLALCERLAKSPFIAVDTEFMPENTYWPDLCLIQIGNEEEAAAIAPQAAGIARTPLLTPLLQNEAVLKLFHAGVPAMWMLFNLNIEIQP